MKKLTVWMAALFLLTACGAQNAVEPAGAPETAPVESEMQPPVESTPEESEPEKTETAEGPEQSPMLVVYFSRVGNTDFPADVDAVSSASLVLHNGAVKGNAQLLAEWMADEAGCETWEITTAGKYPVDYDETTDVAKAEQNENTRPELLSEIDGFAGIEQIYLIYPNWWGDLPMALYSFFDTYDCTGKTIYVSVTHGGSGFSGAISTISELEPGAQIIEGLSIHASAVPDAEDQVRQWVRETGV